MIINGTGHLGPVFLCELGLQKKKKNGVTARALTAVTVKYLLGSALYANAFGCQMESGDTNCSSPRDMR